MTLGGPDDLSHSYRSSKSVCPGNYEVMKKKDTAAIFTGPTGLTGPTGRTGPTGQLFG